MQTFSENVVPYGDGQVNVQSPPDATIANGFVPETASARGQPLPAQWLNWAFRTLFRYVNRDRVSDATGTALFPYANSAIRIEAIDMANPGRYLIAIGFKGNTGVHTLTVTASSTLTLGTPTVDGNQPIIGGTNVRTVGYSRQIGDL